MPHLAFSRQSRRKRLPKLYQFRAIVIKPGAFRTELSAVIKVNVYLTCPIKSYHGQKQIKTPLVGLYTFKFFCLREERKGKAKRVNEFRHDRHRRNSPSVWDTHSDLIPLLPCNLQKSNCLAMTRHSDALVSLLRNRPESKAIGEWGTPDLPASVSGPDAISAARWASFQGTAIIPLPLPSCPSSAQGNNCREIKAARPGVI